MYLLVTKKDLSLISTTANKFASNLLDSVHETYLPCKIQ